VQTIFQLLIVLFFCYLSFLQDLLTRPTDPAHLEGGLWLLFLTGEGVPNIKDHPLSTLLLKLLASPLVSNPSTHPHPRITEVVLEILVRYSSLFPMHREYFPAVLALLLNNQRYPPRLRSRSCSLFCNFSKVRTIFQRKTFSIMIQFVALMFLALARFQTFK
jgi:hypothetical protein